MIAEMTAMRRRSSVTQPASAIAFCSRPDLRRVRAPRPRAGLAVRGDGAGAALRLTVDPVAGSTGFAEVEVETIVDADTRRTLDGSRSGRGGMTPPGRCVVRCPRTRLAN